ncbi:HhH-GPD-type base excision DNA repair protein [Dermatophilaceae bacterium Sec6.4]|nr:Fe-S cluster assembly protein HesB [Actinomycetota bacterium]
MSDDPQAPVHPIQIAQEPRADELLSRDPFALLVGMLLDQQYPMEQAFRGPAKIVDRFGSLDPARIADQNPQEWADLCSTPPAIHRYGRSMAGRVQALAVVIRDEYDGDASRIWTTSGNTEDLLKRLQSLPGFGEQKARIFAALLAKQLGVAPRGWRTAIGPYAEQGSFRSVADVVGSESLQKVRDFKKASKLKAKESAAAK